MYQENSHGTAHTGAANNSYGNSYWASEQSNNSSNMNTGSAPMTHPSGPLQGYNTGSYKTSAAAMSSSNSTSYPSSYYQQNLGSQSESNQNASSYSQQHQNSPYSQQSQGGYAGNTPSYSGTSQSSYNSSQSSYNKPTQFSGYNQNSSQTGGFQSSHTGGYQSSYTGSGTDNTPNNNTDNSSHSTNSRSAEDGNPSNAYDSIVAAYSSKYATGRYSSDDYTPVKTTPWRGRSFRGGRGGYRGGKRAHWGTGGDGSSFGAESKFSKDFDINQSESSRPWKNREKKVAYLPDDSKPLPVQLDPNLPTELVAKVKNSVCEICDVKMTSFITAKNHYEGRPHAKKVKKELDLLNPPPEEEGPPTKKKKKNKQAAPVDGDATAPTPESLYCKTCDVSFTSTTHATSHYMGRNHARRLHGLKPLEAGYINPLTGQWQREPPDPTVATELITPKDTSNKDLKRFSCQLCGVNTTCQDQLDMHLHGKNHAKKLKQKENREEVGRPREGMGTPEGIGAPDGMNDPDGLNNAAQMISVVTSNTSETVLEAAVSESFKIKVEEDISINRTPSDSVVASDVVNGSGQLP